MLVLFNRTNLISTATLAKLSQTSFSCIAAGSIRTTSHSTLLSLFSSSARSQGKMNLKVSFELFLLLVVTEPSHQLNEKEINFAVLAPNSINLNQNYSIIINVAESERPVSFTANLYISKDSNNPFITQEVVVLPNVSKICVLLSTEVLASIQLGNFKLGDYLILKLFPINSLDNSIVPCNVYIKKMIFPQVLFETDKERYNIGEKFNYQITNNSQKLRLPHIHSFIHQLVYTNKLAVKVR